MCIGILIAENRFDGTKGIQRCRTGKSIVCIIGSDDLQCFEFIRLSKRYRGAAWLVTTVIQLVEGHFGNFERVRPRKSTTKS